MKPRSSLITPRTLAASLVLSIAANPLAAQAPLPAPGALGTSPPPSTAAQAVLVLEDGEAQALGEAPWDLDEALLGRADHAWVWSSRSAPRRTDPQDLGSAASAPANGAGGSVALRAPGLRRGEARGLRVVAAPAEMWVDVPESLLPHFPFDENGVATFSVDAARTWRVRLLGGDRGSTWVDLPPGSRGATVFAEPAESLELTVVSSSGEPTPRVAGTVRVAKATGGVAGADRTVARFAGDARGRVVVPSLPPSTSLTLVLSHRDHAPLVLAGPAGQLPRRVRLDDGQRLRGRVLRASPEGPPVPLAGATVIVETWLADDAGALFRKSATTADDGTWQLDAVPSRAAAVAVKAPHLVPWNRRLEPGTAAADPTTGSAEIDLGDVVLRRGVAMVVTVVDDLGRPVAGARVDAGPAAAGPPRAGSFAGNAIAGARPGGSTDSRGRLELDAIPEDQAVVLRATAAGHLDAVEQLAPPFPERTVLRATRAYRVTGRFVDGNGVPILDGSIRIQRDRSFDDEPVAAGGSFDLTLPPRSPAKLIFTSPSTAAVAVAVSPGNPGETLDLGEVEAPAGLTVTGQLLDRLDGGPVAGARVWVPRRMEGGPLVAWLLGQVIETTSDAAGRFALAGLDPVPEVIRIDAPGKARLDLPVRPPPQATWFDAGELWLEEGAAVRVTAPAEDGEAAGMVRVDLRNRGLEIDMVTAPIRDGVAVVEHLPPRQAATVSVVRGRRQACEQLVDLPDNRETVDVDCADGGMEVSGTVVVGGEPVAGGSLVWSVPPPDEGAIILTNASPLGLRRQTVAGGGRLAVQVDLDGEGRFVTHDLAAGAWRVTWYPQGGGVAPEMAVEIPARKSFTVTLEVPGRTVRGQVLDLEGEPASQARVRELGSGTTTLSAPDGTFSLTGLETEAARLEARRDDLKSAVATVEVQAGRSAPWVELRLDESRDDELRVQVLGAGGGPKGGAFVLLEDDLHRLRLLTADRDGRAKVPMPPPAPARVRLAAVAEGVWAFDAWQDWDPDQADRVIEIGDAGSVLITSDAAEGSPAIEGPFGWDVSGALTRLGLRPFVDPEEPLVLAGLPVGRYQVRLGDVTRSLAVESGEVAALELP